MKVIDYRDYLSKLYKENIIERNVYDTLIKNFDNICISYIEKLPRITHEYKCSVCGCVQPTDNKLDFVDRDDIDYCYGCGAKFIKDIT